MEVRIVESIKEVREEMNRDREEMKKGAAKPQKKIVMTPETFAKVFSPKKIRLLITIKKTPVKSISELARKLNRKFEAVHRDISYLEGIGLIKIKKEDRKSIPVIEEGIKIPAIA